MADTYWQPPSQSGVRGRLSNIFDPNDTLIFQYNPEGISERKNTDWAQAQVPGGDNSLDTFGSGQSLQIDLTLRFNIYGEGDRRPPGYESKGGAELRRYVEDSLAFLYRFAEVDTVTRKGVGRTPGVLLLSLGRLRFGAASIQAPDGQGSSVRPFVIPVRIGAISVERTLFAFDWTTVRAAAQLQLVHVVGFPR